MRLTLVLTGMLLASGTGAFAQAPETPATASPRTKDEAAIRENDEAFIKAFNSGDAAALAATFTEDAEVIDEENQVVEGREALTARFAALFEASPGGKITLKTDTLKFVGPETALGRGRADVTTPGDGPVERSRYTVVFVKRDGRWLQASVRDEHDPEVAHSDRLKPLDWLVGDWVSESTEAVVKNSFAWTDDRSFLLREFTVQVQGKPAMTGHERIGWDPQSRQIRSWVFDSVGGFGESEWSHDGDRWMVKARGVRSDGRPASATQFVTRVNKDMIRWRSMDRTVAGKAAPDIDEFVLVRKPEPPKPRPSTR